MPRKEYRDKEEEARKRLVLKVEVLTHYGKNNLLQCCWHGCTVDDADALVLDHVGDNGNKNRNPGGRRKGGSGLYGWIKTNKFPAGYQTLCAGHNAKKENIRRRKLRLPKS